MRTGITTTLETAGSLFLPTVFLVALMVAPSHGMPPDVEIKGFRVVQEGDSGRWEIVASEASYNAEAVAILEGVKAHLVDGSVKRVDVHGLRGRYISARKLLSLEGEVTVRTDSGYLFRTPRIEWNGEDSTLVSEKGVELLTGDLSISGKRLDYFIGDRRVLITGDVRSVWVVGGRNR